ncbi:hypothetical protein FA13DRAFT_1739378 [Coprinellus micaceus]|uniref:Uncharacterized protein n=1 Tax=Coprinellus micaceus TaxID=71717 RepID=A0A4Y7SR59_COPMI|nr:hypothetical protein FA13DRAFT_1739378 [Coprinellus micaceus]
MNPQKDGRLVVRNTYEDLPSFIKQHSASPSSLSHLPASTSFEAPLKPRCHGLQGSEAKDPSHPLLNSAN